MKSTRIVLLGLGLTSVMSASSFGSGFEKAIGWSGKHSGKAGAAVADATGAEALYFNPAGLADTGENGDLSLNFSPTFGKFTGPTYRSNVSVEGKRTFSPVASAIGSVRMSKDWGLGLGFYAAGGNSNQFDNLGFSNLNAVGSTFPTRSYPNMVGQTKTDLKVTEFSAGVGGQLTPNFRVGAAWRLVNVSADMAFLSETNLGGDSVLLNLQAKGLTAQAADAFRLGAQYESTDKSWGLGAMYRSEVFFRAQGKSGGQREFRTGGTRATAGFSGVAQMTEGNVQIQSTFPQQLNVGGFYGDVGKWKVLGEYSWTQYSVNDILDVSGEVGVPNLLGTIATVSNSLNTADLELKWNDQHLYRLGFEKYCEDNLTLRAGFAYTTIVTPDFRAKQTFSTPGAVKAVSLGAGKTFGSWDHNLAGEYTWVSATGSNVLDSTEGTFSSNAYTFHWGSTYRF